MSNQDDELWLFKRIIFPFFGLIVLYIIVYSIVH